MRVRHTNDCPHCYFLGQHGGLDLYYCGADGVPALVVVGAYLPHESRPLTHRHVREDAALILAKQLAIDAGYIDGAPDTGDALERLGRAM